MGAEIRPRSLDCVGKQGRPHRSMTSFRVRTHQGPGTARSPITSVNPCSAHRQSIGSQEPSLQSDKPSCRKERPGAKARQIREKVKVRYLCNHTSPGTQGRVNQHLNRESPTETPTSRPSFHLFVSQSYAWYFYKLLHFHLFNF